MKWSPHSLWVSPMTREAMKLKHFEEYKRESAWTKKYGKRYTDIKELIKDALNENVDSLRWLQITPHNIFNISL